MVDRQHVVDLDDAGRGELPVMGRPVNFVMDAAVWERASREKNRQSTASLFSRVMGSPSRSVIALTYAL
jgi:hypothetical protein